jgi:hypothetical protein
MMCSYESIEDSKAYTACDEIYTNVLDLFDNNTFSEQVLAEYNK